MTDALDDEAIRLAWLIHERARRVAEHYHVNLPRRIAADLLIVHDKVVRIDLQALLHCEEPVFIRDVWGISKHLNRLEACFNGTFRPAFAVPT